MTRIPIAVSLSLAAGALLAPVPPARADSPPTQTISAQDDAIDRSESAVQLSPAMPSNPPALSTAGAPVLRTSVSSSTLKSSRPAAGSKPFPAAAVSPAGAAPVHIRDTPEQVVSGGSNGPMVPGEAVLTDGKERLQIEPGKDAPVPDSAAPPATAEAAAAQPGTPSADAAPQTVDSRKTLPWRLFIGGGAAAFALGLVLF